MQTRSMSTDVSLLPMLEILLFWVEVKIRPFPCSLQFICQQLFYSKETQKIPVNRVVYDAEYYCNWQNLTKPNQDRIGHSKLGEL
jgi:hypothetical protein